MHRSRPSLLGLGLIVLCLACGGGGGESEDSVVGGGGGGSTLGLGFTANQPSPGPDSVSVDRESSSGSSATLAVNITDTNDVWGAAFDVVFDTSVARFVSWAPGTALESGGQTVNYVVDQPSSGRLVVGISRIGNAPVVNVTGTQPLVRLTFQAVQAGSGLLSFQNGALVDDQPAALSGISWAGGTFDAN